ncbi:MAG TPA: MaoC family dehydratase [Cyclobacteriaceae bacterium]
MEQPVKPVAGASFEHAFSFTQADVERFAEVTGDSNPVHLDAAYAATTPFRRPILHGFLSGSVFSKVFGTLFPGKGSVYLSQELNFRRPMFADQRYRASFTILETDPTKGTLAIAGKILDENGKVCLEGAARLMNKGLFTDQSQTGPEIPG